jgi:hypothetical protein
MMSDSETEEKGKQTKSPFRDKEDLKKEITKFINIHKASIVHQADRISDFFEMSCFNYIVGYYTKCGYEVKPAALQGGMYKYKCSTMGVQSNFSHFEAKFTTGEVISVFEIHHNLAVQSAHLDKIFTTPDISVIRASSVCYTTDHYERKVRFSFVKQADIISFCEVKNFNPFPELLFNYIGIINELNPSIIQDTAVIQSPGHIAPCLMISGHPNRHLKDIKESLESRYCINILFSLFYTATRTFSKKYLDQLRQTGPLTAHHPKSKMPTYDKDFFEKFLEEEEEEDLSL